jgi:ABC-type dipeptide/oligopeptide/nickel transport system permease component
VFIFKEAHMLGYLLKRLGQLPVTLLGLFTVLFLILRVMPGDPVAAYLGDVASPEAIRDMRIQFGLDKPVAVQYVETLWGMFKGELGRSFVSRRPVTETIMAVLPNTAILALAALIASSVLGMLAGILAALRINRLTDYVVMIFSTLGVSIPVFWLGLMLIFVFSYKLGLFPVAGVTTQPTLLAQVHALVLPTAALGLLFMSVVARMTRSSVAEVLIMDFIRTVRAKGASERLIIMKHALRNAMIPIVTVIGINTGLLFAGTVLAETVFVRPGVGKLLVDAVLSSDYPVVQGTVLLIGMVYILTNLAVDLLYAWLDPRIKLGG